MYEYNSLGWTGGFTIPNVETRFSQQTCSGPVAEPMDPSSDLVCGRASEISFLESRGCKPVGFQGSHHCFTDAGNQGIFYCCPPGSLSAGAQLASSVSIPMIMAVVGLGVLGAVYWYQRER
jgi:hypothetical protein